jgi:hypothetical protein
MDGSGASPSLRARAGPTGKRSKTSKVLGKFAVEGSSVNLLWDCNEPLMEHAYVSSRVKALQRELAEIAEHNREYFANAKHSPPEIANHRELRERVNQIRAELYALIERTAA